MPGRRTIFIASDYLAEPPWMQEIKSEVVRRGFELIQGPPPRPPAQTRFAPADLERLFGRADVIITTTKSLISREVMAHAPACRAIIFPTAGTDSVDLAAARELGLIVAHGPTPENFNSMAEATVMLMLALMYGLQSSESQLRENRPRPMLRHAQMLMGKTIGLVGLGRIGRGVVERLGNWGVKILAIDRPTRAGPPPEGVELVSFEELLRRSDIVSLHLTLTPETRHIMGAAQFALMKSGAYFINTSRGGLVDQDAVYNTLREHRIVGAALDTFELEPLPADSPLRDLDNVILTPHMVGQTREVMASIPRALFENLENILRGDVPRYCRNPEATAAWRQRLATLAR